MLIGGDQAGVVRGAGDQPVAENTGDCRKGRLVGIGSGDKPDADGVTEGIEGRGGNLQISPAPEG